MRIPHTIPMSTLRAYTPSEQTLMLVAERFRQLRSEDVTWDEGVPPTLAQLCVQILCANFEVHSNVIPFLPQQDLDYFLEILSVDLPVYVVVPIIEDGIYWRRRCEARWQKQPLDVSKYGNSWKRMYVERHVEEFIHYQEPGYIDWKDVSKLMDVCSPYVVRLDIKELKPPRDLQPEPNLPDECIRGTIDPDHMDLSPVIIKLINLQELSLRFGLRNCGMNFMPIFFQVTTQDIKNLSMGLEKSSVLTIFRLHRCDIDDAKVNIILSALIKCEYLDTLEISHCGFGDIAAKSIGHLIKVHKNLKTILIQNNNIRAEGVLGIAYALTQEECCPLRLLDLQFNLIGDKGAEYLSSALTKNRTIEELNLGGAGITANGAIKIAESLLFNLSLHRVILCNNHLGRSPAQSLIAAVQGNRRIETLDIRNCGLGTEKEMTIHKYIARNRQGYRNV